MLDKSFIEKLEELWKADKIVTVGGLPYAVNSLKAVPEPTPAPVEVTSLSSIKSLVYPEPVLFNVINPHRIMVLSYNLNVWKQRHCYAIADVAKFIPPFKEDRYLSVKDAVVNLNTCFHRDKALENLLSLVSSIKVESDNEIDDDGITQTVSAKEGVVLKSKVNIPNPIKLKPITTFPEIEPSIKEYILRVSSNRHEGAQVALHPVQSRVWDLEIMNKIREFLKQDNEQLVI